jgi:N6-L-threonylcarbamoyladenine synthase
MGPGAILEHYASFPPLPPFDTSPLPPLKLPLSTNTQSKLLAFSFAGLLTSTEKMIHARVLDKRSENDKARVARDGVKEKGDIQRKRMDVEGMQGERGLTEGFKRDMARVFQQAAVGHLVNKVRHGIDSLGLASGDRAVKGLVVSGGVACNLYLRKR